MAWLDDVLVAARQKKGPLKYAKPMWKWANTVRLPEFRPFWGMLYAERQMRPMWMPLLAKILYREPLMRYRCQSIGRGLQLEGVIPEIDGDGTIILGDNVRVGPQCSWFVGHKILPGAQLIIGNGVSVNYRNMISVVKSVTIGDRTMIAGNVAIFDNPSHPLSPFLRFHHEPFEANEAAPVVIGRNCWIGTSAFILKGVTIGDNTIVAAGSVVTKSLPPNVLAGGSPAKVLRELPDDLPESEWLRAGVARSVDPIVQP